MVIRDGFSFWDSSFILSKSENGKVFPFILSNHVGFISNQHRKLGQHRIMYPKFFGKKQEYDIYHEIYVAHNNKMVQGPLRCYMFAGKKKCLWKHIKARQGNTFYYSTRDCPDVPF